MSASMLSNALVALLFCTSACGGTVALGSREPAGDSGEDEARTSSDGRPLAPSKRLAELGEVRASGALAVAGEHLYLSGWEGGATYGLYRCKKSDCQATFQRLPSVSQNLSFLQNDGERLAIVSYDPERSIGSVALPDADDLKTAIGGLPRVEAIRPLFHSGFVYWSMLTDGALYRCAMPDCAAGPRKLVPTWQSTALAADGDTVFAAVDGLIVRLPQLGDGPSSRSFPDATLSPAPEMADGGSPFGDDSDYVEQLAAGSGMLYASLGRVSNCNVGCPRKLVRWPVAGGVREEVGVTEGSVDALMLAGQELIWLADPVADPSASLITSCRVDACRDTLRHLGAATRYRGLTFDAERIYWVEEGAVRSAARLATP